MERVIQSIDVIESEMVKTFSVGKEFGGEIVADIIERDGVIMLFNRHDRLITEIKLPILFTKYNYPAEEKLAELLGGAL